MAAVRSPGNVSVSNTNMGARLSELKQNISSRFGILKEKQGLTYHEAIGILNNVFNPTSNTAQTRLKPDHQKVLQDLILQYKELGGLQIDIERVFNILYPEEALAEPGAAAAGSASGGRRKHTRKHRTRRNKKQRKHHSRKH